MAGLAHAGIGFALKWVAPKAPVIGLVVAAEALDLLIIPMLVLPRGTDSISLTHGLFMAGLWSVAAAVLAALMRRDTRTSVFMGVAVFSHWILDFITHPMGAIFGGKPLPPDLPLFFAGSPEVGLGLYNHSYGLAVAFDLGLTVAGIASYIAFRKLKHHGTRNAGSSAP